MIAATLLPFSAAVLSAWRAVRAANRHRGKTEGIGDRGGEEIDRAAKIEAGDAGADAALPATALSGIAAMPSATALRGRGTTAFGTAEIAVGAALPLSDRVADTALANATAGRAVVAALVVFGGVGLAGAVVRIALFAGTAIPAAFIGRGGAAAGFRTADLTVTAIDLVCAGNRADCSRVTADTAIDTNISVIAALATAALLGAGIAAGIAAALLVAAGVITAAVLTGAAFIGRYASTVRAATLARRAPGLAGKSGCRPPAGFAFRVAGIGIALAGAAVADAAIAAGVTLAPGIGPAGHIERFAVLAGAAGGGVPQTDPIGAGAAPAKAARPFRLIDANTTNAALAGAVARLGASSGGPGRFNAEGGERRAKRRLEEPTAGCATGQHARDVVESAVVHFAPVGRRRHTNEPACAPPYRRAAVRAPHR